MAMHATINTREAMVPLYRPSPRVGPVRVVVQRAAWARVEVDYQVVGRIDDPGLVLLVGITHDDTEAIGQRMAEKIWSLRILDQERSASDTGAPLLVVSQFTLYGSTRKGRRPSWAAAAPAPVSQPLFETFVDQLRGLGATVETGVFGAHMHLSLLNDGPVTLVVDSADWSG